MTQNFTWRVLGHDPDGTTLIKCLDEKTYNEQLRVDGNDDTDLDLDVTGHIWVETTDALLKLTKGAEIKGTVIENESHWIGTAFEFAKSAEKEPVG